MAFKLSELATLTGATLHGDGECLISGVADIGNAHEGDIAFVSSAKYAPYLDSTAATAIILKQDLLELCRAPTLVCDNPRLIYARVANLLYPPAVVKEGVDNSAVVSDNAEVNASASVGANAVIMSGAIVKAGAQIGPCCVIEENAVVGANSRLGASVTLGRGCTIGDDCILHSGVVIGADGFGFVKDGDSYLKIPQLGYVHIGNDVEIGANTTIDRGALENTTIGNGVKLDNQIQIAHGVTIGDNTVISAATAIAGSTHIGSGCLIGGVVGIVEHLEITDNVIITGRTMVTRSITSPGSYSSSTPMDSTENWRKNSARFRRLDEMARRIAKLEKLLARPDKK